MPRIGPELLHNTEHDFEEFVLGPVLEESGS